MDQSKRIQVQEEALEATFQKNRSGLNISMGIGKTLIALNHMNREYKLGARDFMVVAPKLSIFKSWKNDAYEFGLEHLLEHIKFVTYKSLSKQSYNYDVIYLDECHNLLFTHDIYLAFYHGKILGLTGTPPRHKTSEKGVMVNTYCPIVYNYLTDEAISNEILNNYSIIVHVLDLDTRRNHEVITTSGKKFYTSEVDHYAFWSKSIESNEKTFSFNSSDKIRLMRMKGLMSYKSKENYVKVLINNTKEKCIIFANTTEQADRLCPNSYHTKNKSSELNLENFKLGKVKCLAAVEQLNEGVNIPDLKYGIIMHAYSNERKTAQKLGRFLRLNPNEEAVLHILAYRNTVDMEWVNSALSEFDSNKITYKDAEYNS